MNHIVLFQPEIPQNTGNIMRTCVATNTTLHLVKPLGFSLDKKYLKRSAANYLDDLDLRVYEDIDAFFNANPNGKKFFLTRYGTKPPSDFNLAPEKEDVYLILGSESSGIPKPILKNHLETCLRLPMTDKVRSLNLSNVAAILIYETLRQQDYQDLIRHEPDIFKGKDFLINN